jgi:ABC-type microcin C transport system permease subunit YejB
MFLVMRVLLIMKILFQVMMMNLFLVNFAKNPNAMVKELMKQVRVRDELLEEQEKLLVSERKIMMNLRGS